jgi:hypothetical protein
MGVADGVAVADAVSVLIAIPGRSVAVDDGPTVAELGGTITGVSVSVVGTTGVSVGVAVEEGTGDGFSVAEAVGVDEGTGDRVSLGDGVALLLGVAVGESRPMPVVPLRLVVDVMAMVAVGDGTTVPVAAKIGVTASRATIRSAGPPPIPSGAEPASAPPPR